MIMTHNVHQRHEGEGARAAAQFGSVGWAKAHLAPCPPIARSLDRWARFALPTLRNLTHPDQAAAAIPVLRIRTSEKCPSGGTRRRSTNSIAGALASQFA